MVIHLLRHTAPNIEKGICYGQADIDLADTFTSELEIIHSKLAELSFDAIIASPLKRCAILAQAIGKPHIPIQLDNRLMELHFGLWELQKWNDIEKNADAKLWFDDYINTPTPNGESYNDLILRVTDFLIDIQSSAKFKNPIIVTHAGVIRAFHCIINNCTPAASFNIEIKYGQIISLDV